MTEARSICQKEERRPEASTMIRSRLPRGDGILLIGEELKHNKTASKRTRALLDKQAKKAVRVRANGLLKDFHVRSEQRRKEDNDEVQIRRYASKLKGKEKRR